MSLESARVHLRLVYLRRGASVVTKTQVGKQRLTIGGKRGEAPRNLSLGFSLIVFGHGPAAFLPNDARFNPERLLTSDRSSDPSDIGQRPFCFHGVVSQPGHSHHRQHGVFVARGHWSR